MTDMGRQRDAANTLEGLEPVLKEIISQLRRGVSDDLAYALTYRFRREVGYVVSKLGYGVPGAPYDGDAAGIIDSQRQESYNGPS